MRVALFVEGSVPHGPRAVQAGEIGAHPIAQRLRHILPSLT